MMRRTLYILICLTALSLTSCKSSEKSNDKVEKTDPLSEGFAKGTMSNETGLDGCGWLIKLDDATAESKIRILNPTMELADEFKQDGKTVWVKYTPSDMMSTCMKGRMAKIDAIKSKIVTSTPRIIFYGTPDFAVGALDRLMKSGYEIAAVVTAPDKPAGRGNKLQSSAVKKYALENNLQVLQPTNLKSPEFEERLISIDPDVQVVVAFRMLPKQVWSKGKLGTFNLHASLLPDYRGAAPINWAIINGEKLTGVTTFLLDDKIDTGPILLQSKVNIPQGADAGQLHDMLMDVGAELVVETVHGLVTDKLKPTDQTIFGTDDVHEAPKLHKDNTRLNWNASPQECIQLIKGLSPYPCAWFTITNQEEQLIVKVYDAEISEDQLETGKLITTKNEILIGTSDKAISILDCKVSGKKRMKAKDLLNGFKLDGYELVD